MGKSTTSCDLAVFLVGSSLRIAEIYSSLQGEGLLTGVPSVFIRTSGCNLRCWFCDTPYTSWEPEGKDLSPGEILSRVEQETPSHVVITGGEPMLWNELLEITCSLKQLQRHITIETAGTCYLKVDCDLMSISPKLSGSTPPAERDQRWHVRHERDRHRPDVVSRLMAEYPYQLKFVVDRTEDLAEMEDYLAALGSADRARVLCMPQGTTAAELASKTPWIEEYCRQQGLQFCPRRHIEWFGGKRGT